MSDVVLRLPLGPAVMLRAGEVGAIFRHRFMLFCYLGAALLGLVGSGDWHLGGPAEVIFALAAFQVASGVIVMVVLAKAYLRFARARQSHVVLNLGFLILACTVTAVGVAEWCDRIFLEMPATPLRFLLAQVTFYGTVASLMLSIMLQFLLDSMLSDIRSGSAVTAGDGT